MKTLSEAEFQTEAESRLSQMFAVSDPFDAPFAPDVEVRRVLYEYWYEMESPLLEAVVEAATKEGDSGFYLSILNRPAAAQQTQPYHWYIPFSDVALYRSLVGPLENVIYSPSGRWGIMGSSEHHGLLGGSASFVDIVRQYVRDLDNQIFDFLAAWVYNKEHFGSSTAWLPGLLTNVYNRETAVELLKQFNLA